jgi:hypothetical protein
MNARSVNAWTEFQKRGLLWNSKVFTASDVDPDGNCFYQSVVASNVLPIPTAAALRKQLYQKIRELHRKADWKGVFERIVSSYGKRVGFYDYLESLLDIENFGSDLEMVLIYVAFGVNMVSISNATQHFWAISAKENLKVLQVQLPPSFCDSNECVYLYHHAWGRPMSPTHGCNHFCVLFEVTDEARKKELMKAAYKGGTTHLVGKRTITEGEEIVVVEEVPRVDARKRRKGMATRASLRSSIMK